ncbi:hypothetical protein O3M35_010635 [Rhynocoris fuscipes]|uniref:Aminopeptidase n=1 Tax=Rhynocoris fuscipes TaxID=488301 RepID=A0AAW1CZP6_9HEMI
MTGDLTKWSSPDIAQPESNDVKFKRKGGLFVTKKILFLALVLFVIIIIIAVFVTKLLTEKQFKDDEKANDNHTSSEFSSIIRLSEDIKPFHYELKLEPYLDKAPSNKEIFTLYGEVFVHLKALKPTSTVTLNYAGKNVKCIVALNHQNKSLEIKSDKFMKHLELYTIDFEENLTTDVNVTLHLTFRNEITDEEKGFYRRDYLSSNSNKEEWIGATNLEPAFARTMFPCFDEPKFRTTFDITVIRLKNLTVLANTNKQGSTANVDNPDWTWDSFERTPPMPTHKVGIVIGDLGVTKISTEKMLVSIWARTNLLTASVNAAEITTALLEYYNSYFTSDQPIKKFDLVAVPDRINDGYTSPWALIIFSESLMFKEKHSKDEATFALEIGTKLAEQWFGNLVSISWWNDLWLKKSLSLYAAYNAINKIRPEFDIMTEFMVDVFQKALDTESYPHANHIYTISDIIDNSFSNSHLKGCSLLHMICSLSSPDNFKELINNHLEERKLNTTSSQQFWQSLSNIFENNHVDLLKFVEKWLNSGYPVVNCQYNKKNGEVLLDQQPFYIQHPPSISSSWDIPISYSSEKLKIVPERKWFYHNDTSLKFVLDPNSWVLVNVPNLKVPQGFFRVNYDIENWMTLESADLREEEIAQLLDNSYQLAKAGSLPYFIPFNISLSSFNNTRAYSLLRTVSAHLSYLEPFLYERTEFQNFIEKLFEPYIINIINSSTAPNNYYVNQMKMIINEWSCKYDFGDCRNLALDYTETLIKSGNNSVETLPLHVLKNTIRFGDEIYEQIVFNRSSSRLLMPKQRIKLLQALTSSPNNTFILELLENSMSKSLAGVKLNNEEVMEMWNSLSENLDLKDTPFNFLLSHWDYIYQNYHSNYPVFNAIIKGATDSLSEEEHLIKLKTLNDRVIKETNTPVKFLEEAMNRLIVKTAWRKTKFDSVLKYFS